MSLSTTYLFVRSTVYFTLTTISSDQPHSSTQGLLTSGYNIELHYPTTPSLELLGIARYPNTGINESVFMGREFNVKRIGSMKI